MKLMPEYAQVLIVGVVFRGTWSWYITEREYWFLNTEMEDRFGIGILDETTAEVFLDRIDELKVSTSELAQKLDDLKDVLKSYDEVLEFIPALYVNFDEKVLYSLFPEPISFEHYVPDGWTGLYKDFLDDVPKPEQYWMAGGQHFFNQVWDKLK
ncbi:hypothetical protein EJP77_18540 [Paenibacillus zeisoli]|uniref:Group-specific protein n=1 Tax=Paenibacillus zeisoli TaxID=2496267 RepID=A0A433X1L2_9BACL|nr:hypothetical protein [Paenibacillus zeisoli]RUT28015.1 hypothetical protein EJP77_18540 [Paenibacillus zeisoli]